MTTGPGSTDSKSGIVFSDLIRDSTALDPFVGFLPYYHVHVVQGGGDADKRRAANTLDIGS